MDNKLLPLTAAACRPLTRTVVTLGLLALALWPRAASATPCSPFDLPGEDRGLFESVEGDLYVLVAFEREGERRAFLADYGDSWRGRLEVTETGALTLSTEGAPVINVSCDGEAMSQIDVQCDSGRRVTADRVPLVTREVRFENSDVRLRGVFVAPPEINGIPAVVFVHGSGPAMAVDFSEFSLLMAQRGIASLAYDKRGAGQSTGDWESATFPDLAGDAVAALETLREQPEVDPSATGYVGTSQGAWVGPVAATMSDPAFLVVSGGGPVTPAQQEFYRRMLLVEESGIGPDEVEAARATLELWFEYLCDPDAHADAISAHWAAVAPAERPWRRSIGVPSRDPTVGEWPEVRRRFARELHYDPVPSYEAVEAPMLGILGLEDQAFPVAETILAFNQLPDDRDVTFVGIPGADHGWFVEAGPGRRIQAREAFDAMIGWIHRVTVR